MRNIYKLLFSCLFVLSFNDEASSQRKKTVMKLFKGNSTDLTEKSENEEVLQYPGNDVKLLEILKQKWDDYYRCLEVGQKEVKKPELRRLIEGQNTALECDICERPFQNFEELEWRYKPLSQETNITEIEVLDLTPEMELLPNKRLNIFNVVHDFEGLYVCFQARNPVAVYVLEISSNDTIEKVSSSYDQSDKNTLQLNGTVFKIEYQWGKWSECSSCGSIGRKYKYATCFVSLLSKEEMMEYALSKNNRRLFSKEDFLPANLISNAENITKKLTDIYFKLKNSTSEEDTNTDWPLEIITKFSKGVPCASPYLPKAARNEIRNHSPAKAIVKYCQDSCQKTEIFEVQDSFGKIELANNSRGIYSMYQKLPRLAPEVERVSLVEEVGNDIVIQCPGTSLANIPVTWKVNKKVIYPEVIANQSDRRFEIDLVNRINLKKLRLRDTHFYSCWHQEKLVGTVHLEVEKKLKLSFDHHITLFGVAAVIGTFLYVGAKIITRTLNSRRKRNSPQPVEPVTHRVSYSGAPFRE